MIIIRLSTRTAQYINYINENATIWEYEYNMSILITIENYIECKLFICSNTQYDNIYIYIYIYI